MEKRARSGPQGWEEGPGIRKEPWPWPITALARGVGALSPFLPPPLRTRWQTLDVHPALPGNLLQTPASLPWGRAVKQCGLTLVK